MAWVMKNIKNYSNKCKCILQIKYKNVWVNVWESQDALGGGGGGGEAPFWKCPIFFCPHRLRTIFFPNFCSILVLQTCRTRFFLSVRGMPDVFFGFAPFAHQRSNGPSLTPSVNWITANETVKYDTNIVI